MNSRIYGTRLPRRSTYLPRAINFFAFFRCSPLVSPVALPVSLSSPLKASLCCFCITHGDGHVDSTISIVLSAALIGTAVVFCPQLLHRLSPPPPGARNTRAHCCRVPCLFPRPLQPRRRSLAASPGQLYSLPLPLSRPLQITISSPFF